MTRDLKKRIKEFNKIKFKGNNDTRIIVASLIPDYTIIWKDGTKTYRDKNGTVTTAPK